MLPLYLAKYKMWQKRQADYTLFIIAAYLEISDTVKLVKLWKNVYMSTIVLDKNSSRCCFHWSVLLVMKVYLRRRFETWPVETRCIRLLSITELINLESVIKNNGASWTSFQIIWPILLFDLSFGNKWEWDWSLRVLVTGNGNGNEMMGMRGNGKTEVIPGHR